MCKTNRKEYAVSSKEHTLLVSRSLTSLLEAVLETAGHGLQVLHATSSLSTAAGALEGPIVYIQLHVIVLQNRPIQCTYNVSS